MKRFALYLFFVCFTVIICNYAIFAETLNVPDEFETIQGAINASENGDVVLVQPGEYDENVDFNGHNITVASLFYATGDPEYIGRTIIDGHGTRRVVSFISQENRHAVLTGFTIRNGSTSYGAGIYIRESSPTLENLIITANHATHRGGGVYCTQNSNPTLSHVTIAGNTADDDYSGIHAFDESNPTVVNSILWGNNPPDISDRVLISFSDVQGGFEGEGNSDVDPLFGDADRGDFNLTENSPCIDAGSDIGNGFNGELPDLGALETGLPVTHFRFNLTDNNHSILVVSATLDNEELPAFDEIGIFSQEGLCCGGGFWNGGELGLAAWGDDPGTEIIDGFVNNEVIEYRIWDFTTQRECIVNPQYVGGEGNYVANGFSAVELEGMTSYHWEAPEPTDNNHSLLIESASFNDESLDIGDEIGVFTADGLLAGYAIWNADDRIGFAVWGDAEHTEDIVEGFVADEAFTFVIWDYNVEVEIEAVGHFVQGPSVYTEGAFSIVQLGDFEDQDPIDLVANLPSGWSMMSINVDPADEYYSEDEDRGPDVPLMMAELTNRDELEIMKNDVGQFYMPGQNFNNIPYWDLTEGFQIKVTADCSITWTGVPILPFTQIPLSEGWNVIAYFPDYELPCEAPDFTAFVPILDELIIAKDGLGRFALPENNFSNVPPLTPTMGYHVKVSSDVALNYPDAPEELASSEPRSFDNSHWVTPKPTGKCMNVLVNHISGIEMSEGDQVVALNSSGNPVGVGTVDSDGRCGLAVWGDDLSTDYVDGLRDGESFEIKLFSIALESEIDLVVNGFIKGDRLEYTDDSYMVVETSANVTQPQDFYLSPAHPNPFNAITRFTYGMREEASVSIQVFDIHGRLISTITDGVKAAGQHVAVFDGNSISSGLYIISMSTNSFSTAQKIMLVK